MSSNLFGAIQEINLITSQGQNLGLLLVNAAPFSITLPRLPEGTWE